MTTGQGSSDPDSAGHVVPNCICNKFKHVVKCKGEGAHPHCEPCINNAVRKAPASTAEDFRLKCLKLDCTEVFTFYDDLHKHIDSNIWNSHLAKNNDQQHKEIKELRKHLESAIDRHLSKLALIPEIAGRLHVCPALVVITRCDADDVGDLKTWFKNLITEKFNVVFYCERSFLAGHEPFEISVNKKWIRDAAPWLRGVLTIAEEFDPTKVSKALHTALQLFLKNTKAMKKWIKVLEDEKNHGQQQTLRGEASKAIGDMAYLDENKKKWEDKMQAVTGTNGRTMWVKRLVHEDASAEYEV